MGNELIMECCGKKESECDCTSWDEDANEKIIIKLMDILDEYHFQYPDVDARQYAKDIIKLVRGN